MMQRQTRMAIGESGGKTRLRPAIVLAILAVTGLWGMACGQAPTTARAHAGYVLPDGTIRIVGSAEMKGVIEKLDALFAAAHPGLKFHYESADNNGAIAALIFDATPFAPVGTVYGGGIAYSDIVKAPPFSVRIAHGSLLPAAKVSPLAVIVNPGNPVDAVTLAQLAAMLSKPPRMPVIAAWHQMGVAMSSMADEIEPAGLPWSDHYPSEDRAFGDDLFFRRFSGAAVVDSFHMFSTYAEVVRFVAGEPGAVGVVAASSVTPAVKVIGLIDGPFGAVHRPTEAGIRSGHYPLDRYLYLNARVQSGKPLDALVTDYIRFALSAEGQAAIASEGEGYLPLNQTELDEENGKMEEAPKK